MTSRPDAARAGGPGRGADRTGSDDRSSRDQPGNDRAAAGGAGNGAASGSSRALPVLVALTVGVVALDLLTKSIIVASLQEGQRVPLLGNLVALQLIRNPGAAFSLATGMTWVLTLVALAVVAGIVRYARRLRSLGWAVALGLVLGGALGNLSDRFFRAPGPLRGHVVDFVSIGWWPVFNVADSAICIGGATLVVLALMGREIDGSVREPAPVEPDRSNEVDPDDVASRSSIRWPKNKWDALPGAEGSEPTDTFEAVDEDDRPPSARPRHPANKWERG